MNNREIFTHLELLNAQLHTLTEESEGHLLDLKSLCNAVLREIDILKTDVVSAHITLTKGQARQYINKGLLEIGKYNHLGTVGNFTDVLKPIHAGLVLVLNLDY